jgi:hypothetical protein
MGAKFLSIFADTPVLFFAVVIGVALTFRIAVGVAREAATPEVVAPTFATGVTQPIADPEAKPNPAPTPSAEVKATVGAAAKVQPLGAPARVAPKPRGHGRRPVH